jgi:hypothetical protein
MRFPRRTILSIVTVLILAPISFGQITAQVPSKTLLFVRVKNLQDFSQKTSDESKLMGPMVSSNPWATDLLGSLTTQMKIQAGLNKTGDFGCALMFGAGGPGDTHSIVLIPVSDYAAFIGNFAGATTDTGVTTAPNVGPANTTLYIANWGAYAAATDQKALLDTAPDGLTLSPAAAKELDSCDACAVLNMPEVRTLVVPWLITNRAEGITSLLRGIRQSPYAKYASVVRVAANQGIDFFQELVADCTDVTFGISLAPDGTKLSIVSDFKPDSDLGQLISGSKSTDKSLLAGLPNEKYLYLGAGTSDPQADLAFISKWIDPVQTELVNLGPEGETALGYIQSIKDAIGAQNSAEFGLIAPEGELGTSPLMQMVVLKHGDAKAIAASTAKIMELQEKQAKNAAGQGVPMQMTFTPAAKTVGDVVLDQYHIGFDMAGAQNPAMAKIGQIFSFAYGMDGMNVYTGIVNDSTFISVGGVSDDVVAAAIAAAKSNDDTVNQASTIQDTASHLPTQRLAVAYLPVDVLVNTGLSYAAKFGLDMGVTMPATDPIGATASTDGSAARLDVYIPSQVFTGISQVTTRVMMHAGGAGGPPPQPGGGPPPAGGL